MSQKLTPGKVANWHGNGGGGQRVEWEDSTLPNSTHKRGKAIKRLHPLLTGSLMAPSG